MLIIVGGMHGNEKAGVRAIDLMIKMLEVENITNPGFEFQGKVIGVIGNLEAYRQGKRFLTKDINRMWLPEHISYLASQNYNTLTGEDKEIYELEQFITYQIMSYQPTKVVLLDLHTTSAGGGIFSIIPDDASAKGYALSIDAPVILGMLEGLTGTTLHYFNKANFNSDVTSICFESGQHDDPLSINRAVAAITNCLRYLGCVKSKDVESRHIQILQEQSKGLPRLCRLDHRHHLNADDQFVMLPGFNNFDPIIEGQLLAHDKNGPIYSKQNGFLLMPLYQPQGEDGFFIIREISNLQEQQES